MIVRHRAEQPEVTLTPPCVLSNVTQRFKMAAISNSMRAFEANKLKYIRYHNLLKEQEQPAALLVVPDVDFVWVTKRYDPTDLRVQVPVARFEWESPHSHSNLSKPSVEANWQPAAEPFPRSFFRTQNKVYASFPNTRCEEFSTLRQMLPSIGSARKVRPPDWGSGHVLVHPPYTSDRPASRFPIVESPMTRYMNVMHQCSPNLRMF